MIFTPYQFRPVEEWKSSLMILPDSSFFDLMRSIFGNIKTPFNKQRLVEDLFALLSREDIRKTIAAYLNHEDHKVISAVALLGDPALEELEDFFTGDPGCTFLRGILLNLEERLILYRFRDADREPRRLALNPVLEPVLAPLLKSWAILFPSETLPSETLPRENSKTTASGSSTEAAFSVSDDRNLGTLFAFILEEEDFLKAEGIRKKVLDQGKRLFPGLDLEATAGVLLQLGLFYSSNEKFLPVEKRILDFSSLSGQERREYWAAAFYLNLNEERSGFFPRNRLKTLASLIHSFCGLLDPKKQYPEISLRRWLRLLEHDNYLHPWCYTEKKNLSFSMFLDTLQKAEILGNSNQGAAAEQSYNIIPLPAAEKTKPAIAMDSAFSLILYPGISFTDVLKLASFCSVSEDSAFCFELSRSSVVKGFDRGMSSAEMLGLLKDLSGDRIDSSLEWTLREWESRYAAVTLHEGLILSLSEERSYLAKAGPVASLIRKCLAPGLYLLSGDSQEALAALQKAGVDIVGQPQILKLTEPGGEPQFIRTQAAGSKDFPDLYSGLDPSAEASNRWFEGRFSPLDRAFPHLEASKPDNFMDDTLSVDESGESSSLIQERFRQCLKNLKVSGAERDELAARIERRMILTETQLEKAVIKYERLEARGLDYVGKASIAKEAIASGSVVEVSWPGPEGGINVTTGVPSALEKKEGESILIIKPSVLDDKSGEENNVLAGEKTSGDSSCLRIPLGKISHLRRIKQSIFGE